MCNCIPIGRVKNNRTEAISEKTMAGNFPKMVRDQAKDSKHTYTTYTHIYLHILE